jgi:hypothetical protein
MTVSWLGFQAIKNNHFISINNVKSFLLQQRGSHCYLKPPWYGLQRFRLKIAFFSLKNFFIHKFIFYTENSKVSLKKPKLLIKLKISPGSDFINMCEKFSLEVKF